MSRTIKDLPPALRLQKRRQMAERSRRVPRVRVAMRADVVGDEWRLRRLSPAATS